MNNYELKKKICKIIADNYLPKEMPDRLEDYKLYRFARAADALIAAGLGFMNDDITAQIVATIKRDTAPITMECVALRCSASIRKRVMEAEHRAEVAERALKIAADLGELCAPVEDYIQQAERELAEGNNND